MSLDEQAEQKPEKPAVKKPMSETARVILEAANEARNATVEAANLRYNARCVHAAKVDGIDVPANELTVSNDNHWILPDDDDTDG